MPLRRRIRSFLDFYRQAWRLGKKLNGFDAVLAYSAPLSVGELGRRLARYHGFPLFFEVADVWPDVPIGMGLIPNQQAADWLLRRTQRIYDEARRIFPFSPGMAQQIKAHDVPAEKVIPILNGSDLERIAFQSRRRNPLGPIEIIYSGTVGMANGLTQLVHAMQEIERQGRSDIHCTVLGYGNDLERVKAEAKRLALQQLSFESAVSREEATARLAEADIGVVCFANHKVLEANAATKFFDYLASGLPLVINYQGWQAEYLAKYRCGLASPQGNVLALAQNLIYLASAPELRDTFSRNGRKLAEAHFDRRHLAAQMMQEIEQALT